MARFVAAASSDVLSDDLDSDEDEDDLSPGADVMAGSNALGPNATGAKPRNQRGNNRPHGPVVNK